MEPERPESSTPSVLCNVVFPSCKGTVLPSTPSAVRIRTARREDLSFVVAQHQSFFPDGFFVRLGGRFLSEYYRSFMTDRASCVLVAEESGRPVGYLVGTPDPDLHRHHVMRKHGKRLCLLGLGALLRQPNLILMFLRTRGWRYLRAAVRHRSEARVRRVATRTDTTGVLNHVAVLPEHQGEGIGSLLIQALEEAALAAGCDRLVLVTGSDGLAPAYCRSTGWSYVGERCTPEGYWLNTFSRGLDGPRRLSGGRAPDYMHFDTGYLSRRYRPVSE